MAGGDEKHPGMMGDGTEEQNLGQTGQPDARIRKEEIEEAFGEAPSAPGGKEGEADAKAVNAAPDAEATSADQQPTDNSHNFN